MGILEQSMFFLANRRRFLDDVTLGRLKLDAISYLMNSSLDAE